MDEQNNKEKITILSEKDLEVSYFIGSGKGGQKKQKTHSGVQIKHPESGAIGRCSETRSQAQNKRIAFDNLLKDPRMKFWISKKLYEIRQHETLEETVERTVIPENLKFEIKKDGKWTEVDNNYFNSEEAKYEI